MTTEAAPAAPNGSAGAATPAAPAPTSDTATGPQTPTGPARGADGKFASTNPKPPEDDDPEIDLGDMKLRRSALKSEIGRARNASKLLTEARKEKEEAARLRAQEEERKSRYKSDLSAVFSDLGMSDEEAAEAAARYIHEKHIKPSEMTAEQRRIAELEAQLGEREKQEQAEAKKRQEEEGKALQEKERGRIVEDVKRLLDAGKLKQSPAAVKRVADRIYAYEAKGVDLPVEEAARMVREELATDTAEVLEQTSIDELKDLWGPQKFKTIALKFVQWGNDLVTKTKRPVPQSVPMDRPPAQKPDDFISPADFLNGKFR